MSNTLKEFQQKIKNRKFAIDNSWKGSSGIDAVGGRRLNVCGDDPQEQLWKLLEENIMAADAGKYFDGYLPIQSDRKLIGRGVVLLKKVMRRFLKITMGWYIFPQYQRMSHFNEKMVNAVSLERDLLLGVIQQNQQIIKRIKDQDVSCLVDKVEVLKSENERLQNEIKCLKQKIRKMENIPTDDDEFYHSFEEKFRGSQELIRERLKVYLPILRECLKNWPEVCCIDVGSGRGEWLDILREQGVKDYVGIDLNERQNRLCKEKGHNVLKAECIAYLSSLSDNSVDIITGFQIIEHLCISDLLELFRQSYRVLKSGGVILFETQNPRNLIVGANTFYIDPSHKRPVNFETVSFLAEWCGYKQVRCIDVNAWPNWAGVTIEPSSEEMRELVQKFNDVNYLLYGPQDYAVLAVKE